MHWQKSANYFKKLQRQKRKEQKQKSNGTSTVLTRVPVERYQFQGWKTNYLPDKPCPFQGCRPLQQRMIVA